MSSTTTSPQNSDGHDRKLITHGAKPRTPTHFQSRPNVTPTRETKISASFTSPSLSPPAPPREAASQSGERPFLKQQPAWTFGVGRGASTRNVPSSPNERAVPLSGPWSTAEKCPCLDYGAAATTAEQASCLPPCTRMEAGVVAVRSALSPPITSGSGIISQIGYSCTYAKEE